jgi:hypothetical protein
MYIEMSIPIAGDQYSRTAIPVCFPKQIGDGSFVCDSVGWDVPADLEAWVNVYDPTLGRRIATTVFVNDQRVTRVRVTGSDELGDFHFDARGTIH